MKKQYKNSPTGICEACRKNSANSFHHKFSRTQWALKLYGPELLDDRKNLQAVCNCHASHANPNLTHWSESDFCLALNIEPRSKEAKFKNQMQAICEV